VVSDRETTSAGIVLGGLLPIALAAALVTVRDAAANTNIALALVVAVVIAAVAGGQVAGAVAAVSAALSFDFFHTQPYLSLTIDSGDDAETTVLLLVVGVLVGTIAARGRRARQAASQARDEIQRVHKLAELTAAGEVGASVVGTAQGELIELLSLDDCRFEAPPYETELPVLERSGALSQSTHRYTGNGFELPAGGVSLPVLARGRPVGRFVLTPHPGVGLTLERRIVAVALADQVGGALAARHA
jgi:Domain of unknown function (DUF4118)